MAGAAREPLVVLDDDPTGVQTLAGIRVLSHGIVHGFALPSRGGRPSTPITNTRALPAARVRPFVAAAARAALDGVPDAAIVLRGDSTLRGHLLEEYSAPATSSRPPAGSGAPARACAFLRRASHGRWDPPLRTAWRRAPLHETEARATACSPTPAPGCSDGRTSARAGCFSARRAGAAPRRASLPRARRRDRGAARPRRHGRPGGVRARRGDGRGPRSGRPGYRAAAAHGASVIVRCAPTFAGCSPRRRPRRSCRRLLQGTACWSSAARTCRNRRDNSRVCSTPGRIVRRGRRRRARGQRPIRRDRRVGGRGLAPPGGESVGGACDAPRAASRDDEPRSRERIAAGLARVVAAVALSIPASGEGGLHSR